MTAIAIIPVASALTYTDQLTLELNHHVLEPGLTRMLLLV